MHFAIKRHLHLRPRPLCEGVNYRVGEWLPLAALRLLTLMNKCGELTTKAFRH